MLFKRFIVFLLLTYSKNVNYLNRLIFVEYMLFECGKLEYELSICIK